VIAYNHFLGEIRKAWWSSSASTLVADRMTKGQRLTNDDLRPRQINVTPPSMSCRVPSSSCSPPRSWEGLDGSSEGGGERHRHERRLGAHGHARRHPLNEKKMKADS
jgi:hypothetical protein